MGVMVNKFHVLTSLSFCLLDSVVCYIAFVFFNTSNSILFVTTKKKGGGQA